MRTVKSEFIQTFYDDGDKCDEKYRINGKLHRENGYAYKNWWDNGNKRTEEYYINNKLHRENGYAFTTWDRYGNKRSEEYYINGKELNPEEYKNRNNSSCNNKIVEVDGKRYRLMEV